jgi:hypothetical protein
MIIIVLTAPLRQEMPASVIKLCRLKNAATIARMAKVAKVAQLVQPLERGDLKNVTISRAASALFLALCLRPSLSLPFSVAVMVALASGCTTMETSHYKQAVLIQSEPPGAKIISGGEELATTPAFVRLRRSSEPVIELKTGSETREVHLDRNYRWRSSFFSNLIFIVYAPIGWLADYVTGTAWNIHDSPVIQLQTDRQLLKNARAWNSKKPRYAIAPPLAESLDLSDAAGRLLEHSLLHSGTKAEIKPYDETLDTFVGQGYDYDGVDSEDRRELFYDLHVDGIYESSVERQKDRVELHAQLRIPTSKEPSQTFDLNLSEPAKKNAEPSPNGDAIASGSGQTWLQLLPNTVSIDAVADELKFKDSAGTIDLNPAPTSDLGLKAIRLFNAVGITSLPARRIGRASRWQLTAKPAVRLSRRTVVAANFEPLLGQEFTRTWISGGYGLEAGYQVSRHYFYLNLIPLLFWNEMKWQRNGTDSSATGTGLVAQAELGYMFYFNSRWALSFFTRTYNEDGRAWQTALSKTSGADFNVGTVVRSVAGLSINYRFEPEHLVRALHREE